MSNGLMDWTWIQTLWIGLDMDMPFLIGYPSIEDAAGRTLEKTLCSLQGA